MNEIQTYAWGKWPEHLLTKKQMSDAGFQTGKKLPSPAGKVKRSKSPDGWMYLYDKNQGVPKRKVSPSQKAAIKKAQYMSEIIHLECIKCGCVITNRDGYPIATTRKRAETWDRYKDKICFICKDHDAAIRWSQQMLEDGFVVLDTETTGLNDAQMVQIAVIDHHGNILLDTLVKPTCEIMPDAIAIHGITQEMVANAPTYDQIYDDLAEVIGDKYVVIYNASFDSQILDNSRIPYRLPRLKYKYCCAMEVYSQYCGEWSSYHGNYRWQKLPGGDHSALGDCRATLAIIKEMASHNDGLCGEESEDEVEPITYDVLHPYKPCNNQIIQAANIGYDRDRDIRVAEITGMSLEDVSKLSIPAKLSILAVYYSHLDGD